MAGRLSAAKKEEMVGEAVAMSVRGATYTEIAQKLEVTRNTAASWIKNELAQRAEHATNEKEEAKAHYREVIRAAWESYQKVDDRSLNKSGHLNAAIRAQERLDKITGAEAPKEHNVNQRRSYEVVWDDVEENPQLLEEQALASAEGEADIDGDD